MAQTNGFGYWGDTSEEILRSRFPLHRACRDGDVDALSALLLEAQHEIYSEDIFYGWTPAHWAAYFGKLSCLMRLLQTHFNCDACSSKLLQTPAHIAAFACQARCLKWLIHCGASMNKQDYLGETAVHKAARTGSIECASLLASHGARLFICNKAGYNPAQLAKTCGFDECAMYLESVAASQAAEPRGVYQMNGAPSEVHPCVISHGINGGKLPMMSASGDCAMEDEPVVNGNVDHPLSPPSESLPLSMVAVESGDDQETLAFSSGVPSNLLEQKFPKRVGFKDENADPNPVSESLQLEMDTSSASSQYPATETPAKCHGLWGHYI
ncbi:hypothetical protein CAPTEDRAFT_218756 [Capitella teleta]|uniref:Uncharacterized protein n=1 Tax=Capitella teleta TaxID=283909 RepID=R7UFS3_CAPTE|nr:hypothetical protein CAPTEDRAFT_218756 [Capitella teleta]|eukprot:ELU04948.1 hypothetical protein CAPTEDRAFT_218756 [Capitella teleta]